MKTFVKLVPGQVPQGDAGLLQACPFPVRYIVMAGLFFAIILFGCYGDTYNAQQFIYFQF